MVARVDAGGGEGVSTRGNARFRALCVARRALSRGGRFGEGSAVTAPTNAPMQAPSRGRSSRRSRQNHQVGSSPRGRGSDISRRSLSAASNISVQRRWHGDGVPLRARRFPVRMAKLRSRRCQVRERNLGRYPSFRLSGAVGHRRLIRRTRESAHEAGRPGFSPNCAVSVLPSRARVEVVPPETISAMVSK